VWRLGLILIPIGDSGANGSIVRNGLAVEKGRPNICPFWIVFQVGGECRVLRCTGGMQERVPRATLFC
jgi:hypothetical protein